MTTENALARRTKRRYAHELFPHPDEGELRPLSVDVPYFLALAIGLDTPDTSAFSDVVTPRELGNRIARMLDVQLIALLADALQLGLTGEAAWAHVPRDGEARAEKVWRRAEAHGVDIDLIKPYPCGPEPDYHWHEGERHYRNGFASVALTRINVKESDCEECTEPIEPTALAADEEEPDE